MILQAALICILAFAQILCNVLTYKKAHSKKPIKNVKSLLQLFVPFYMYSR